MLRQTVRVVLAFVLVAAVLDSTGRGQPAGGKDRVYYRDAKTGTVINKDADLKPLPTGMIQVVDDGGKVIATVSPADLVRVVPADVPGFDRKAVADPVQLETKHDWEGAKKAHDEMLRKSSGAPEKVRKYLEFRQAVTAAHAADDAADEATAQAKAEEAVKLLTAFLAQHKTGWEAWAVAHTEARLQVSLVERKKDGDRETERRQFEEAARTWGRVARNADLPTDLRVRAGTEEIDLLIRAGRYGDAVRLLPEVDKSAPAGPEKDRLRILGLAAKAADGANPLDGVPVIEKEVERTKDAGVRATGYGMIGELYLVAGKPREAMWAFLWVEVVYNHNKDEVVKAMVRLADANRLQGEEDRARAYREKARRYRGSL